MSDRDSSIRHPLPPPTSLSYAGSISLERLWAEDNERDPAQHAALVKLQGCPPNRAESAWARQQSRQAASKNRHFCREEPMSDPDAVVDQADRASKCKHLLRTLTSMESFVLTHRHMLDYSLPKIAAMLNTTERQVRDTLERATDRARRLLPLQT